MFWKQWFLRSSFQKRSSLSLSVRYRGSEAMFHRRKGSQRKGERKREQSIVKRVTELSEKKSTETLNILTVKEKNRENKILHKNLRHFSHTRLSLKVCALYFSYVFTQYKALRDCFVEHSVHSLLRWIWFNFRESQSLRHHFQSLSKGLKAEGLPIELWLLCCAASEQILADKRLSDPQIWMSFVLKAQPKCWIGIDWIERWDDEDSKEHFARSLYSFVARIVTEFNLIFHWVFGIYLIFFFKKLLFHSVLRIIHWRKRFYCTEYSVQYYILSLSCIVFNSVKARVIISIWVRVKIIFLRIFQ